MQKKRTPRKGEKVKIMKTKLQKQRQACGYSQSQLAERAGVNIRMLQHYEQGQKPIDKAQIGTVLKLSAALECPIADILETEELTELAKSIYKSE